MKCLFPILLLCIPAAAQNLQVHYDLRRTVDPSRNKKNFPSIYFEYWKGSDSGSILFKMQADLIDENNNIGKGYFQIARSFRIYKLLQGHLSYSGGLGLTRPREYSYSISNTFQAGFTVPFQWQGAFLTAVLDSRLTIYRKPSIDPMFTLYWWKGLLNYKLECLGDFSVWTENRDHGDEMNTVVTGKKLSFFAEPQGWYNFKKGLAAGIKINLYYHVLTDENILQLYPSIGWRCRL